MAMHNHRRGVVMRRGEKSPEFKGRLSGHMREVFENEPSTVRRAKVSKARKRKMKIAIAFAKTRRGK